MPFSKPAISSKRPTTKPQIRPLEMPDALASDQWGSTLTADCDDPAIRKAAEAHSAAFRVWDSLNHARSSKHPDQPLAAHLPKVEHLTRQQTAKLYARIDQCRAELKQRKSELFTEIKTNALRSAGDANLNETRMAIRSMNKAERVKFLSEAVMNGEADVVAALMSGTPTQLGIDREPFERMNRVAAQVIAPHIVALDKRLDDADNLLMATVEGSIELESQIAPKAVIDEYENDVKAYDEAMTNVLNSID